MGKVVWNPNNLVFLYSSSASLLSHNLTKWNFTFLLMFLLSENLHFGLPVFFSIVLLLAYLLKSNSISFLSTNHKARKASPVTKTWHNKINQEAKMGKVVWNPHSLVFLWFSASHLFHDLPKGNIIFLFMFLFFQNLHFGLPASSCIVLLLENLLFAATFSICFLCCNCLRSCFVVNPTEQCKTFWHLYENEKDTLALTI